MSKSLIALLLFCISINLHAANSLSYSGRLVLASGAPVTGPVNLRAELVYTNAISTVLCSQNLSSVTLTKGVFHLKLDLNCGAKTLTQVLSETPNGESVAIRIIDQSNSKTYPLQAIHSVPFSKVAEQLPQMGASSGQALAWDGTKWAPTSVGTGNGTVMSVNTGTGLTGGPITTSGTISVAVGGITSTELAANAVTASKINAGEITSAHISATANIPYSKLQIGVGEIPQDRINGLSTSMSALIEDVITDAVTGKAPSQNAVYDALALKADRANVAQNVTAASVVGLVAPTVGSAAANRDYVDTSATNLDTRITNEVGTLNTALGTKYDKAGGVISGDVTLNTQMLFKGGSNFVTVKANSGTANYTMTLPTSAGTSGYVLQTDGAGVLSWVNPSSVAIGAGTVNSASIADGSIVDADIDASANIAQSKILNLTSDLSNKEPIISAGTIAQYFRGNKTWSSLQTDVQALILNNYTLGLNSAVANTDSLSQAIGKLQGQINSTNSNLTSLTTTNVSEGTNLYFTKPRVLSADLLGFNNTLSGPIVATDTVLQAFGRTQKQINDLTASISGNQWTTSGGNIYRPTGNVGINVATPASALDVNGTIRALEICDELGANCKDISTGWGAAAGTGFGSWETRAFNTNYQASTDGFAVVWGAHAYMLAYSDASATPTTKRMEAEGATSSAARPNLTMPVKKGDYWRVDLASGSGTVYWISLAGPDTGIWTLSGANAYKTTGNIGIGTSTPTHKLDVSGNVNATQVCIAGDCKSAWPTGVSAGSITTTEILDGTIATADIADGAVSLVKLGGTRDATKYLKGDNTWSTFATDAINSVLSTFSVGTGTKPAVTNSDTVAGAFGKVQKTLNDINEDYVSKTQNQTINGTLAINSLTGFITVPTPLLANDAVNKSYVDGLLTWIKNGSNIYFNTGNVGVGTNNPQANLHIQQTVDSTSGGLRISNLSATATTSLFVDVDNRTHLGGSTASPNALVIDNATGFVGFNTLNPLSSLDLSTRTDAVSLPKGTTAQQPGTPVAGMLRFNTTTASLEVFDGSSWVASIAGGTTVSPAGLVSPFSRSTCPAGWLEANGATVSRATYASLFSAIGTTFGAGDGSTTFALPDLRGEFIRGFDNGRGVDTGRVFGSWQKPSVMTYHSDGNTTPILTSPMDVGGSANSQYGVENVSLNGYASTVFTRAESTAAASYSYATTTNDSFYKAMRPRNVAMVYCVSTATAPVTTVANSGTGTTNKVPVWTSSTALGDSPISVSGNNVGVGTASPASKLDVSGAVSVHGRAYPWRWKANSSGTINFGTTTWIDIVSVTVTLPAAADVEMKFDGSIFAIETGIHCSLRFVVNGTPLSDNATYGDQIVMGNTPNWWQAVSRSRWIDAMSAGTHTIKVQGSAQPSASAGDKCRIDGSDYSRLRLTVMGYPTI